MAHFAVGAGCILLIAVAIHRFDSHLFVRHRYPLAFVGGIWALIPDFHHMIPDEQMTETWRFWLHDNWWVDLFFFHYTMDHSWLDANGNEAIFIGLCFLLFAHLIAFILIDDADLYGEDPVETME